MNYNYLKIGERIRKERKALKQTQTVFAENFNVTRRTVSNWENGEYPPNFQQMIDMCKVFDCEMGYLLCEDGYENKTRATTDICEKTGFSEKAVYMLEQRKECLKENENSVAAFTSFLIENGKEVYDRIEELKNHNENMKQLEESEYCEVIHETYKNAKFSRENIATVESEEDIYFTLLENAINNKSQDTTVVKEKKNVMKNLQDKGFTVEQLNLINRSYPILKMQDGVDAKKFAISNAFMDIVKAYLDKSRLDYSVDAAAFMSIVDDYLQKESEENG